MDKKSKVRDALKVFCAEFRVPQKLTFDGSKEQTSKGTEFMKQIQSNGVDYHIMEPEQHNQNPAEGVVRLVHKKWFCTMVQKRVPRVFWEHGTKWVCQIMRLTYTVTARMNGSIPQEVVTGETQDMSEHLDFSFCGEIWCCENTGLGPRLPGRWLECHIEQAA